MYCVAKAPGSDEQLWLMKQPFPGSRVHRCDHHQRWRTNACGVDLAGLSEASAISNSHRLREKGVSASGNDNVS